LQHKNLVQLVGIIVKTRAAGAARHQLTTEPSSVSLVTEYMAKGSLVDYLRSRGRQHITRMVQIDFACDTCEGMKYLESKKVIHRDLAARNVLINDKNVAKISDFGLAQYLDGGKSSGGDSRTHAFVSSKLPIKWTAPEALKNSVRSSPSNLIIVRVSRTSSNRWIYLQIIHVNLHAPLVISSQVRELQLLNKVR
jgi:c-src tyrosine kinase